MKTVSFLKIYRNLLIALVLFIVLTNTVLAEGHIYDYAGVLDEKTISELDKRCERLEKRDANLVGITVKSLDGEELNEYAERMGKELNIGKKGILFVLVTEENKVGYYKGGYYNDWFDESTLKVPAINSKNASGLVADYVDYYCDGLGMLDIEYSLEDYKNIFICLGVLITLTISYFVINFFAKKQPYFKSAQRENKQYKTRAMVRADLFREHMKDEYKKEDPYDYI